MKLFRRLSALVMALVLVLSLSISVLAANFDNMADGFAYDGKDTEVNINLGADDWWGHYEAKEGKTYNIGSDNGSSLIYSEFGGSGTVNIDSTAVKDGLSTGDQVDVTINGDVDTWLNVCDQSSLTVNGDMRDELYASDQSVVTVNGDMEADLFTYGQSSLTVNGDVNSGVSAGGQSEITVNGDVNGDDGDPNGVDFSDPYSGSYSGSGIYADGESTVTVTGNVSGGDAYGTNGEAGTGIIAYENATVTVGGDVTGGNVTADPNTKVQPSEYGWIPYSRGGNGVDISDSASVSIGGNVIGGSTNGDEGKAGSGISVASYDESGAATVTVAGTVTGGKAENGTDADGIYVELVEGAATPSITVSGYDSASGVLGVWGKIPDEVEGFIEGFVPTRDLTQAELDEIITIKSSEGSSAGTAEPYYGTSFYYSRGRLINEYGVNVKALFAFGNDWEETVENGTVTITSAEEKGEIVVTVESLKVMMDVGIETILFNGTKLVLKDAVAERTAYDTYTVSAGAILLNGAAI